VDRRAIRARLAALLVAGLACVSAEAADRGLERLQAFLDQVQSMRATFRQEIVDGEGRITESSSGRMSLKRPGRFRWDYEEPYERVVAADGKELWLYEADLQQVTVRPLGAGLGETPAALLTGDRAILDRFEHVESWRKDGLDWIRLRPRATDSDFDSVALGFQGDRPARLEIDDRLGQRTRLFLADVELNARLADESFSFHVPEGVDVIREGAP
jgi:chaperone LolA